MNLEPCPFCENKGKVNVCQSIVGPLVKCDCGAEGPSGNTVEEAVDRWNRRPALAAAVQAEREAILSALQQMRDAESNEPDGRGYGLGLAQAAVKARSSPAPAVGEWRLERSGLWRFVVGERCLASVSTNINRWYTFSPEGGAGESGYVGDLDSAKRAAVDALVRQGWYSRPSPAVDVMAVVREYIDARANCDWRTDTVKRYAAASNALRALIEPARKETT